MLLSGDEIKKRNLIGNGLDSGYRAASYDLHVGKVLTSSGEEKTNFVLKPQGTVMAVSRERIKLPNNVAGYATVKTKLCHDGVLAINIGIVDPEYDGLVSSYLINFGKKDFSLNADQPFLRLTLHEFTPSENPRHPQTVTDTEYVNERRNETVAALSDTFLDLPTNIKNITDKVLAEWKKDLFVWVPVVALVMALLAFSVTLGVTYGGREVPSKEQLKAELAAEIQARSLKNIDEHLAKIDEHLAKIDDRLTKVEQAPSSSSQPAAKPSTQQGKMPSRQQPPSAGSPTS